MGSAESSDLVQQVVGANLQSLDLCQQLHVLHLVVRDDFKAVLIVTTDNTSMFLIVTYNEMENTCSIYVWCKQECEWEN